MPKSAGGKHEASPSVVVAGPNAAATLATGRQDYSGKECLPYQLIWGGFRTHLAVHPPDRPTSLRQVTNQGARKNCMFAVKDRLSLERMGLSDQVSVAHFGLHASDGVPFALRIWGACARQLARRTPCDPSRCSPAAVCKARMMELTNHLRLGAANAHFRAVHASRTQQRIERP